MEGADVGSLLEYLASIATLSSSLPGDQYALLYQSYTEPNAGAFKWTQPEYDVLFSAAPDEQPELFTRFKNSGRLDFHVDLANVSAKEYFEAKIRGVELIFDGGQYAQVFNPVVQHWGRSAQQHRPGTGASSVEQALFPTFELIPVAPETGNSGVQHASGELNRSEREPFGYWGRGLGATYSLEVKNLGQPGSPKLDTLTRLTVRFRVDTFATGLSSAQLAGVSFAAQALLTGATAFAALELAAPAPEGGAVVTGKSSHPGIVLRTVTVAAGERAARLPIEVAPHAAGATAVLLARSSATTRTIDVVVPTRTTRSLALLRPSDHQGMHVAVQGLEADERFVYAAYYLQNPDNVTPPAGNGVLAVIDRATWNVLHRVPVGIQPVSVAVHVNAQRRRLFVVNRGVPKVSLSAIDLALDGTQVKAMAMVPLQAGVVEEILTVNPLTRTVNRLDLELGPQRSQPRSIAFEPAARRLYVGMLGAAAGGGSPGARPNVTAIDLQSKLITPMYTPSGARMVALDARGQVYAARGGGG